MRSSSKTGWEQGYLNIFGKLRRNSGFIKAIEQIRNNASKREELFASLFSTYRIPSNLYTFIKNYVDTGDENPNLIQPSVQIISDFDEVAYPFTNPKIGYQSYLQSRLLGSKEIKIVLDYESNLDEIIETLRLYRKEIENMRMNAANENTLVPRRRSARKIDRDTTIKYLYDTGMKPKAIEKYLNDNNNNPDNLTGPDISKIVHKMK